MCQREIYEADVGFGVDVDQFGSEVVYCRIFSVIVPVGESSVVEEAVLLAAFSIFEDEVAFVQSLEKGAVRRQNFGTHEFLEKFDPLVAAVHPALFGSLAFRKQMRTPHRLSVESEDLVVRVCDGPSDGIGSDIEPQVVFSEFFRHANTFLSYERDYATVNMSSSKASAEPAPFGAARWRTPIDTFSCSCNPVISISRIVCYLRRFMHLRLMQFGIRSGRAQ